MDVEKLYENLYEWGATSACFPEVPLDEAKKLIDLIEQKEKLQKNLMKADKYSKGEIFTSKSDLSRTREISRDLETVCGQIRQILEKNVHINFRECFHPPILLLTSKRLKVNYGRCLLCGYDY